MGLLDVLGLPALPARASPAAAPPASGDAEGDTAAVPRKRVARARTDEELKELAKWPSEAHGVWKRLSTTEHAALLVHMSNRYGAAFTRQFIGFTESGPTVLWHAFVGPFPEYTPDWFRQHGYRLVQKDSVNEWWTQPSGRVMWGPFGHAGELRAAEIADQKGFDAALGKARKAVEAARQAQAKVLGMEQFMQVGDAWDPDRPREYDIYQKTLQDMDSQAEAAQVEAEQARKTFSARRVDVSAIGPVIDELAQLGEWAASRLGPGQIDLYAPRPQPARTNLPPAGGDPIDFSGQGGP